MTRPCIVALAACAAFCVAGESRAQTACTRADLQTAVDSYLAAQTKGSTSGLTFATPFRYIEQMQDGAIEKGILRTPLKIDSHRSLLDVDACETFTEAIVTDVSHPYVFGIRLTINGGRRTFSEIEAIVTDRDDWLFNAGNYAKYSTGESWGVIPAQVRDTRTTLIAAANAYEDRFSNEKIVVPFGTPCNRLEGGVRSGKGTVEDSCNAGFPTDMPITDRRFVVDPDIGAVVVLSRFSVNKLPDSHLFRVEMGKIRFVHTLTVCTIPSCGFAVRPPQSK